jgi:hypothetical protein
MTELTDRQLERFWDKIDKDGPGGCWIWTGGMGLTIPKVAIDRRSRSVPRLMYEMVHNVILARNENVLRSCEVDRCVNPDHLVVGKKGWRMKNVEASKGPRARKPDDIYEVAWMVGYDLERGPSGRLRVVKL